ncbi:cysteine desulfurase family protein [Aeoliella mucimassa]|uniref:cysteine desulfurase n=1 Tax=Aeoliella mucimassa TaxID=2527972 RepID=A0A518ARI4_9BACT|nr:cysteine desulfurase family protein [Aeoliella mucimassa]QDU57332.1 Cysteine desulfurase [Aeoliella mucimassa]
MDDPIYLDHHATTPVDPRVAATMWPYMCEQFGNPGSTHAYGEAAREAVAAARASIAAAIGAEPSEIVFTSGATESNNLAIRGVAERPRRRGDRLVSVWTEHPAVLDPLGHLGERGYDVVLVDVAACDAKSPGVIDLAQLEQAITDTTCLVSVMLVNNEIGVVQPLAEISALCKQHGALLHCDATQGVGKLPVDVDRLGVDLMSFTAHKLYGPKGVGALYVRRRNPVVRLLPQQTGGGQEQGRRSGTLNVPGIVGFAEAVRLAMEEMPEESPRVMRLRNALAEGIQQAVPEVAVMGPPLTAEWADGTPMRLPGNLNMMFPGTDGEALMLAMPEVACSSGAACSTGNDEPSHVLQALGLSPDEARSCLRFCIGRWTTDEQVRRTVQLVAAAVRKVRQLGGT